MDALPVLRSHLKAHWGRRPFQVPSRLLSGFDSLPVVVLGPPQWGSLLIRASTQEEKERASRKVLSSEVSFHYSC